MGASTSKGQKYKHTLHIVHTYTYITYTCMHVCDTLHMQSQRHDNHSLSDQHVKMSTSQQFATQNMKCDTHK